MFGAMVCEHNVTLNLYHQHKNCMLFYIKFVLTSEQAPLCVL